MVGHIDLDLTHQLAAVVRAVEPLGLLADEVEADMDVDQPKQVITRNPLIQCHHLQSGLSGGGGGRLEHATIIKKETPDARELGFVSNLEGSARLPFLLVRGAGHLIERPFAGATALDGGPRQVLRPCPRPN